MSTQLKPVYHVGLAASAREGRNTFAAVLRDNLGTDRCPIAPDAAKIMNYEVGERARFAFGQGG